MVNPGFKMMDSLIVTTFLVTAVQGHMQLVSPAPFNATNNPHRTTTLGDPYLQYPYDCCGPYDKWEYPCRGYIDLLGTPDGEPTATWEAGSTQTWSIAGIGNHFGGSCQVGFSTDKGDTFKVATSYEGNCPRRYDGNEAPGQEFNFTVPADIEPGVHVFAWIWYNREQEFNMNCAAVRIADNSAYGISPRHTHHGAPKRELLSARSETVAWLDRPEMLVADDGNGCLTPHPTAELKYPNPGPDVVSGDGVYPLVLPSGNCAGVGHQAYDGSTGEDGHGVPH
ncbi:Hypothetical protein R9X50_00641500 [Acrodontium crateriforme]|uniref:Lytic polysaccharide monooxygenase n=1 Tax=Acrodontium crateriforme TaxID=150365 RepID=A0AAQ3M934_9PEZI|nr:Hypothetical protein R9X50_00641500 [Acrodontium crateriforme]